MAHTTINKFGVHHNTAAYSGTSSGAKAVTGVGFQPDFIWFKQRNATRSHVQIDVVRGVTKAIQSDVASAEHTNANYLASFDSDGFTTGATQDNGTNTNGGTYAAWNFKAGGAGSANTDGSINSTVSANTTAGFSIVKWTGSGANATIGHGLNAVPGMIIVKNTSTADSWMVYHVGMGANAYMHLETTNAALSPSTNQFQATAPTSSLFSVGTADGTNKNTSTMIAYCFADKPGYCSMGRYQGNGDATTPPFIWTGFKPKFVIVKNISETDSWFIHDYKRDGRNDDNEILFADITQAETTNINRINFFANGFNVPTTDKSHNKSNNGYVYLAIGQTVVGTNNVPTNAR